MPVDQEGEEALNRQGLTAFFDSRVAPIGWCLAIVFATRVFRLLIALTSILGTTASCAGEARADVPRDLAAPVVIPDYLALDEARS